MLPVGNLVSKGWDSEPLTPGVARGHPWLSLLETSTQEGVLPRMSGVALQVKTAALCTAPSPLPLQGCKLRGSPGPHWVWMGSYKCQVLTHRHTRQTQLQPCFTFAPGRNNFPPSCLNHSLATLGKQCCIFCNSTVGKSNKYCTSDWKCLKLEQPHSLLCPATAFT